MFQKTIKKKKKKEKKKKKKIKKKKKKKKKKRDIQFKLENRRLWIKAETKKYLKNELNKIKFKKLIQQSSIKQAQNQLTECLGKKEGVKFDSTTVVM